MGTTLFVVSVVLAVILVGPLLRVAIVYSLLAPGLREAYALEVLPQMPDYFWRAGISKGRGLNIPTLQLRTKTVFGSVCVAPQNYLDPRHIRVAADIIVERVSRRGSDTLAALHAR